MTPRRKPLEFEPLMTPAEVAHLFAVSDKTVTRWDNEGRLHSIRTLGNPGHRRFYEKEVRALYDLQTRQREARRAR